MKTINREHSINVFVDIGIIEAAVRNHKLIGRCIEFNGSVRKITGCVERFLVFFMNTACRNKCHFAFIEGFL